MTCGVPKQPLPEDGCALVFGGAGPLGALGAASAGLMAQWSANTAVTTHY